MLIFNGNVIILLYSYIYYYIIMIFCFCKFVPEAFSHGSWCPSNKSFCCVLLYADALALGKAPTVTLSAVSAWAAPS